ncbi:thioredoxin family protein [Candidatus Falkowbacteria bacterium]|nr:thioredoxin family protein [Candidatus Falkowbacteria bacterium]
MRIVKFTALWCADCIVMRPSWDEVKTLFPELEFEEYDFDDHAEVASRFQIKKVPHTIVYDEQGNELLNHEGMMTKTELINKIKTLIQEN